MNINRLPDIIDEYAETGKYRELGEFVCNNFEDKQVSHTISKKSKIVLFRLYISDRHFYSEQDINFRLRKNMEAYSTRLVLFSKEEYACNIIYIEVY